MTIWPQDTLVNPTSNRRNVDDVSKEVTDRQFFCYVHRFEFDRTVGGIFTKSHIVQQNYNYWISNIMVMTFTRATNPPTMGAYAAGKVRLIDNEQGYAPFDINLASIRNPFAHNSRRPILPEPYVIRAGQSFTTELLLPVNQGASQIFDLQLLIQGWKDYSY